MIWAGKGASANHHTHKTWAWNNFMAVGSCHSSSCSFSLEQCEKVSVAED